MTLVCYGEGDRLRAWRLSSAVCPVMDPCSSPSGRDGVMLESRHTPQAGELLRVPSYFNNGGKSHGLRIAVPHNQKQRP
jgi:hypothetical protein